MKNSSTRKALAELRKMEGRIIRFDKAKQIAALSLSCQRDTAESPPSPSSQSELKVATEAPESTTLPVPRKPKRVGGYRKSTQLFNGKFSSSHSNVSGSVIEPIQKDGSVASPLNRGGNGR